MGKNAGLGGTTTSANVAFRGLFHAWGEQVIAGIGWELVCRAVELGGDELPDFRDDERPHWQRQVRVNAPLCGALLLAEVNRNGVGLRLHTMLAAARWTGELWELQLRGKDGLETVTARRLVDCTGDADVIGLAGLERRRNQDRQPGTIASVPTRRPTPRYGCRPRPWRRVRRPGRSRRWPRTGGRTSPAYR